MEQVAAQATNLVIRTLDVLEALAGSGQPMSLGEVAISTSTPKASVHRLLQVLQSRGYVAQESGSGRYSAGIRCFELGSLWAQNLDLRSVAAPHLAALNEDTRETVHLGVYENGDVIYIDRLESPQQVIAKSYVGRRCPATCVATGRVLLAYSEQTEIDRVLGDPLPAFTANSITDPEELRSMLVQVRAAGCGINHGSYRDEVGGLAAPVRDHTGRVVASVGLCLPEHRFGEERTPGLRDRTIEAAVAVSRALGGPAHPVTSAAGAIHVR
jgi:DNA-binding IclR family transcriptional regulator